MTTKSKPTLTRKERVLALVADFVLISGPKRPCLLGEIERHVGSALKSKLAVMAVSDALMDLYRAGFVYQVIVPNPRRYTVGWVRSLDASQLQAAARKSDTSHQTAEKRPILSNQ